MINIQIMETVSSHSLSQPHRYYIDCPIDVEMHEPEVRRIEIPRELAKYIKKLQSKVSSLQTEAYKLNASTHDKGK